MPHDGEHSILILGNYLSASGGSRAVCEDLAERLACRGWDVSSASGKRSRVMRLDDMLHAVIQKRNRYRLATVDVFSGMAFLWAEWMTCALRMVGKPYILILHGGNLPSFSHKHPARVKRSLDHARAVVAPSRYLVEQMGKFRDGIHHIPNGMDTRRFSYRHRMQIQPRFAWLRTFHKVYQPTIAVQALAELVKSHPEAYLRMAGGDSGDGSLQECMRLAMDLGVTERVDFSGRISPGEVPGWLQQSDIFLNTTSVDNTPVSVMEAMACGLPVVSTNVGGIPYLLEDGVEALLVPSGDALAMAGAIENILAQPDLGEVLSTNARRKAEQFDWHLVIEMWEAFLVSILTNNQSGGKDRQ